MTMLSRRPKFKDLLPLLVSTYNQGRLVPFLGAGMSVPCLALWDQFVGNLEKKAEISDEKARKSPDVRAQAACTKIRNSRGKKCLLEAIQWALDPEQKTHKIPPQTEQLSRIRWPLVVSTNYDDLYLGACQACGNPNVQVMGRSPKDCKTVMSSLQGPFDGQFIWHIQGFLGGEYSSVLGDSRLDELQDQLVIGHAEYRAVTNASPHFRRCFGQMFESRSFLFLGSSLTETYFMNLFGEILELCGPSHIPHFALAKKNSVDTHFLAEELNITVCEFDHYDDLPARLQTLAETIVSPHARVTRRSFMVESESGKKEKLQIVLDPAPSQPHAEETIAFVARRNRQTDKPEPPGQYGWLSESADHLIYIGDHTVQYGDRNIYALTARCKGNEDDNAVYDAVIEFLNHLIRSATHHKRQKVVHLQLSDGGTVPPVFAFMKVVRTFGKWARKTHGRHAPLCLILHIQQEVELNLTSGRIDVQELLSSELIRFWAIVSSDPGKEPVRRVIICKEDDSVGNVLDNLGVPFDKSSAQWSLSICPAPRKHGDNVVPKTTWTLAESHPDLLSIGVLFGSVLTIECMAPNCPENVPEGPSSEARPETGASEAAR